MNDPYWELLQENLEHLQKAYNLATSIKPVMLYDVQEEKIYNYSYKDFLSSLNPRSQLGLTLQYQEAEATHKMVVFVKDNKAQLVRSYIVKRDDSIQLDPSRVAFVRSHNKKKKRRKKKRRKKGKK